ncbi:hypothetical protein FH972_025589 [Carpinus fangiana]|uniref:Phosphoribulokinase/uridine kinase domain-containing protein n=1 Tax=Carpinus fangiana TaxID=176857 RepID=A0A5N6L2G5_9ROSI|nr:hypothetical protein FH972_025589 [Carpinus fangiana]
MDGFHLTRAQLATMPDPAHAAARRGAAFTFDAPAYLALVRALREPVTPESTTVRAPSFDHAVKDPVEDDIAVGAGVRVVVFEGLYVAMGGEEWGEAAGLMDETWFVEVEEARAKERLVRRHVASGIEKDREAAARRAEENDLVNGREILERLVPHVTERIQSKEDDAWKPGAPDDAPGKDVQV